MERDGGKEKKEKGKGLRQGLRNRRNGGHGKEVAGGGEAEKEIKRRKEGKEKAGEGRHFEVIFEIAEGKK